MNPYRFLFYFFEQLLKTRSRKQSEYRDKVEMLEAGSLNTIYDRANSMGIDLFEGPESNGYVKNNNNEISAKLCAISPNFNARQFVQTAQRVFEGVTVAQSIDELEDELKLYVADSFDFSSVNAERVNKFSASYMHLYKRVGDNEMLQVFISFTDMADGTDKAARRFLMRFQRRSQFEVEEYRRVKATACPNCGAPVHFKRGNTEKCGYCGQYVMYEEHGWQLYEVEEITASTYIDNVGVR